ncbi:hypothetical protein CQW23_34619 [Capsicum baccatum]|uniref:Uncharacterized protein n=1 Tax=Capsicum baccatum TaxID=33114 RepID=A0A2G2UYD5_CAPBA|nr:hypothetical protein CQW23_34619 [Capsicum baccatum]
MIGRADIERSKSNVAMNAWLPQASYPCGNFSDTSSFEFRRSKGSLDVPPQPNSPPDNVFRPDRPVERALGPKREHWAEITLREHPLGPSQCFVLIKQSDSPVRTSSELVIRRTGKALEGTVPSPSPGRHAATRSCCGSSSRSPPIADGFGTGPPCPALRANPFAEVTDPFCQLPLPTLFHQPEVVHLGDLMQL